MAAGTSEYGTWRLASLRGLLDATLSKRGFVCLLPPFWVHGICMLYPLPPVDGCCARLHVPVATWTALRAAWQNSMFGLLVSLILLPLWEASQAPAHVPERLQWLQIRANLHCVHVLSAAAQQNLKQSCCVTCTLLIASQRVEARWKPRPTVPHAAMSQIARLQSTKKCTAPGCISVYIDVEGGDGVIVALGV